MLDEKQRDITILCQVVDNFGDIGFVYRLSRAISEVCPEAKLRLVVSDLASFARLEPKIDAKKSKQDFAYNSVNWQIFDWNNTEVCKKEFEENHPLVVLQCFQCERPLWLDEILFSADNTHISHIINVEYLTAEDWADEFHCLKSATRSKNVKKVNFMPGFTDKTGGLVLDTSFMKSLAHKEYARNLLKTQADIEVYDTDFNVVIFSYERDFSPIVRALCTFEKQLQQDGKKLRIFVTDGKSKASFQTAIDELHEVSQNKQSLKNRVFLPFLPQNVWDALLTVCDFNFVRGEDSLSRAVLAGKPFVWHAYPQENEWQTVKVKALMQRISSYLRKETASLYNELMIEYNKDNTNNEKQEALLEKIFSRCDELKKGLADFAEETISIGNLAENLCIFISHLQF